MQVAFGTDFKRSGVAQSLSEKIQEEGLHALSQFRTTAANLNATITGSISNTSFIATQATAANLNVTINGSIGNTSFIATQATAANLNATVVGTGTFAVQAALIAGTATAGTMIAVQPTAANLNVTAVLAANSTVIATQATAANLNVAAVSAGDVAAGTTDSGNPVKIGAVGHTANPTAVTDGQRVNAIADKLGKQICVGSIRELKGKQITTISTTGETTIITAATGFFLDVYGLIVANTSATACNIAFKDATAGTTEFNLVVPGNDTRGFMLPEGAAITQSTASNVWSATLGTAVTSIIITALYVKNL